MKITELSVGDEILATLLGEYPAILHYRQGEKIYISSFAKRGDHRDQVTVFRGTIISNNVGDRIIKSNMVDRFNTHKSGIIEAAYGTFSNIYLWEGETNADTVVQNRLYSLDVPITVDNPHTMPPSDIFRKKIRLVW